jgi:hypothetical protein
MIEVSDEEYAKLIAINKELTTQDNGATADPIWILYDRKIIKVRQNSDEDSENEEDPLYTYTDDTLVNVFFTEKACKKWLSENWYHIQGKERIFIDSLWRNGEMQLIRNILWSLPQRIKPEQQKKE